MTPQQARRVLKAPAMMDQAALTRAFRSAVKETHPDRGGDGERLRLVVEAHAVLKAETRTPTRPRPTMPASPSPACAILEISVAEAVLGATRLNGPGCSGGALILPVGLRAGELLRIGGQLMRVVIRDEDRLSIRGDDLWVRSPATDRDGRVEIETPHGRRVVWLSRKAGAKRLVRLPGEGLPARGGRRAGDLIVRLETCRAESPARQMLHRFSLSWAAA